jgi:hypothetical protein
MNWRADFPGMLLTLAVLATGGPAALAANGRTGEPPVAGRPDGFSGAVGVFRVSTRAEPTILQAQNRLVFTIRITVQPDARARGTPGLGWASLEQIERPELGRLRSFARRFAIESAGQRSLPGEQAREFDYELRPLSARVKEIPAFPFVYWTPGMIPDSRGYQTALAPAIPLTVRPLAPVQPSEVVGPAGVQNAPESVYAIARGPRLLGHEAVVSLPGPLVVAFFMVAPPLLWTAWLIAWKRRHPDLARQARQRRSRAAGRALHALRHRKTTTQAQEAEAAAAILVEYLREHLGFATLEPSPSEIAAFLESLQLPAEQIARARRFFEDSLAARFGPGTPPGQDQWTTTAGEFIEDWENRQVDSAGEVPARSPGWTSLAVPALLAAAFCARLGQLASADSLDTRTEREAISDMDLVNRSTESFQEGVKLLDQPQQAGPRFLSAAGDYRALEERGFRSPVLARNAGNAYLLGGDLPRAILEYRSGLRLAPADSALRANLAYARGQVAYPEESGFARPAEDFPLTPLLAASGRVWLLGTALLYPLAWLALARWWIRRTALTRAAFLSLFFLTACSGVCLAFDINKNHEEAIHPALVLARDDVFMRKGNGDSYPLRSETPLNRGVEARLLGSRGNWFQIELASGEIGWIPASAAILSR